MRLTLVLLLAWLQIYCNSTVLSLPPSLIADAASLVSQQQQEQLQQQLQPQQQQRQQAAAIPFNAGWLITNKKKKNKQDTLADRSLDSSSNVQASNRAAHNNRNNNKNNPILSRTDSLPIFTASAIPNSNSNNKLQQQQPDQPNLLQFPNEYEINSLLSAAAAIPQDEQRLAGLLTADATANNEQQTSAQSQAPLQPPAISPRVREIEWNEFFSPMKYLTRRCQPTLDNDCLRKYALEQQHKLQRIGNRNTNQDINIGIVPGVLPATLVADTDVAAQYLAEPNPIEDTDDILMMLTGEENLIKFLHWAMQQLKPKDLLQNFTRDGIALETNQWKKLNLSGQREPLLFVEEPHYMIVRREPTAEDLEERLRIKAEPFIPPRGRKYQQMPELEKLLNRYDTFVPNRGRRDKIKDIFKYDDLFYPNRGKKQSSAFQYQVMQPQLQQQQQQQKYDDFSTNDMLGANAVDIRLLPPTPTSSNSFRPWSDKNDCLQQSSVLADRQPLLDVYNKARMHAACINNDQRGGYSTSSNNDNDNDDDDDTATQNSYDNEIADNDNDIIVDNWPRPRMPSNDVKFNEYDQSVKISMPTRDMSTLAFLLAQAARGAQAQQKQHQQQWAINNKGRMMASALAKAMTAAAASRQHRFGSGEVAAAADTDGVAANRLHSTRSMLTMQQHQQQQKQRGIFPASFFQAAARVPAFDKRWLQLNEFNKNWLLHQQTAKQLQQQQQHLQQQQKQQKLRQRQLKLSQQLKSALMRRHLQLLPTDIFSMQTPSGTELANMEDIGQPSRQLMSPTFIDDNYGNN